MFRKILLYFLLCVFANAFSLDELAKELNIDTKGNFTQEKRIVGFENSIKSSGEFIIKDKELTWSVTDPINSVTKITKDGIFTLTKNGFEKVNDNGAGQIFNDILSLNFNSLKKEFDIKLNGDFNAWQIELKPNGVILKKIFSSILITGNNRLEKIELFETNGDVSINKFSIK